jgi:hypothetical protein
MMMTDSGWSEWRRFPDPRKLESLTAPFGPGCYELREGEQKVLFGRSNHVAKRMTSLLPKPHGSGTRNNSDKRDYVCKYLDTIEYRTLACASHEEATKRENELRKNSGEYLFKT